MFHSLLAVLLIFIGTYGRANGAEKSDGIQAAGWLLLTLSLIWTHMIVFSSDFKSKD